MPENTAPEAAAPNPAPDTNAIITAAIAANDRASRAEARAAMAEDAARRASAAATAAATPRPVDPLERLATEDITLPANERKNLLAQAIEVRARTIAGKAIEVMRDENRREIAASEQRTALEGVMRERPEISSQPEQAANFAAAMTKAKFEFDQAGVGYTPAQLANRARDVYDSTFRPKVDKPPFVEGGINPNLGGLPQGTQVQQGKSMLEEAYGMKEGQISPAFNPHDPEAVRKMTNDYVNARNKPLLEKGAVTQMTEILRGGEI